MDDYDKLMAVTNVYRIVLLANAALCTVIYPPLAWTIVFKSPKEMSCYRWFLFNAATTCYVLTLLYALWQPVPMFPMNCMFSASGMLDPLGMVVVSIVFFALISNFSVCYMFSFVYYYATMKIHSPINRLFGCMKWLMGVYGLHTAVADGLIVAFVLMSTVPPKDVKEYVVKANGMDMPLMPPMPGMTPNKPPPPAMNGSSPAGQMMYQAYMNQPTMSAVDINIRTAIPLLILCVLVVGEILVVVRLSVLIGLEIRKTRAMVQESTHRMQMMIYRVFLNKALFFLIFFVIPFFVAVFASLGLTSSPYATIAAYALFDLHTPFLLVKFAFIKPYKAYWTGVVSSRFNLSSSGRVTPTNEKLTVSTSASSYEQKRRGTIAVLSRKSIDGFNKQAL